MWLGGQRTPRLLYYREGDPVPNVQEIGWTPGRVWTGVENLAATRIRSPALEPVTCLYTDCAVPARRHNI
jgi:hypothetical protein